MTQNFGTRVRNLSNQARWLIAIGVGLVLLLATAGCSLFGALMMTFATDACRSPTAALNLYFFLPPGVMALGSIAAPVLFGLRVRWQWSLAVWLGSWLVSTVLYILWLPIVANAC